MHLSTVSLKLSDEIENILKNILSLLDEDVKKELLVKEKFGPQETPPERKDFKTEHDKCQEALFKANQTNNELGRVYDAHKQNLELIAGSEERLLAALPSLNIVDSYYVLHHNSALTEANAKYAKTRKAVKENSQRREEAVQALILSFNTFCELQGKLRYHQLAIGQDNPFLDRFLDRSLDFLQILSLRGKVLVFLFPPRWLILYLIATFLLTKQSTQHHYFLVKINQANSSSDLNNKCNHNLDLMSGPHNLINPESHPSINFNPDNNLTNNFVLDNQANNQYDLSKLSISHFVQNSYHNNNFDQVNLSFDQIVHPNNTLDRTILPSSYFGLSIQPRSHFGLRIHPSNHFNHHIHPSNPFDLNNHSSSHVDPSSNPNSHLTPYSNQGNLLE
ncbi:hypothetical protein QZH41_004615 [Actinostola sp. cb2023]|nr:hypothetical protein QZH41_004615 [Actinostola sp. cb2023]